MRKTHILGGLVVVGLVAHLLNTATEPVAPLALAPVLALEPAPRAPEHDRSRERAQACLAAGDCALHLAGFASRAPWLQLSVAPEAARDWRPEDWQGALALTRAHARWARAHPAQALADYASLAPDAPAFARLARALPENLKTVSVGVAERAPKGAARPGVPGWDARNAPELSAVPVAE